MPQTDSDHCHCHCQHQTQITIGPVNHPGQPAIMPSSTDATPAELHAASDASVPAPSAPDTDLAQVCVKKDPVYLCISYPSSDGFGTLRLHGSHFSCSAGYRLTLLRTPSFLFLLSYPSSSLRHYYLPCRVARTRVRLRDHVKED